MLHQSIALYAFPISFFMDIATTETYTLSLHDALPISAISNPSLFALARLAQRLLLDAARARTDRKSTRLNSSHVSISYAVFCLKKKIIFYTLMSSEAPLDALSDHRTARRYYFCSIGRL